ncbi:helix-turn-helix domain-containing protein [Flavobacterium sp. MAHUQ-51]|uniref:helix-turn-helix domain-containing protein n=1 Tax=Flavobacterium sp. GCM10022190 TaxID=3252639 RepID=UPI00360E91B3
MEETQENIKIKIAISLNKLLDNSKKSIQGANTGEELNVSYSEIADNSDIRKATVSDIFNAKKSANTFTLFRIIKAMGYELNDFAKKYDKISNSEITDFKIKTKKDV